MTEGGLRERGKARRRAAVVRAALELFAERGYDATTVADIAARAEVAPRTVAMYFPAKQDIAMARFDESVELLTRALRQRENGRPLTGVLDTWVRERHQGEDAELTALAQRMFRANPDLRALRVARMSGAIRAGAEAVADDIGASPDDAGPRIAAAAAAAVLLELGGDLNDDAALTTALRFLRAGLESLSPR